MNHIKPKIKLVKEDGWIVAECPELPGCVSQGKTEAEALANISEAMVGWLWAEEQKAAAAQLLSTARPCA
jgi:predicted RNase H-like HicB family nuclease